MRELRSYADLDTRTSAVMEARALRQVSEEEPERRVQRALLPVTVGIAFNRWWTQIHAAFGPVPQHTHTTAALLYVGWARASSPTLYTVCVLILIRTWCTASALVRSRLIDHSSYYRG